MPRSQRGDTREKLLQIAEEMILHQGFAATSIDQIIDAVGVTKGSFFYHFKSKNELALALIRGFAERDQQVLQSSYERALKWSDDPKERLFLFVGLMIEIAEQLDSQLQPGCLFATYCYESKLFGDEIHLVIREALANWRLRMTHLLDDVASKYPPRLELDTTSLADMLTVLFEGAFVFARVFESESTFTPQLKHYRNYLRLLFG